MESRITDWQLREWGLFFESEPWGSEIEWMRTGTVAAMVANASPNRRPQSKAVEPRDFIPNFEKPIAGGKPSTRAIRASFLADFAGRVKFPNKED